MNQETLKKLHQKELEILKIFINVCKQLDLKYYAVYGTALGAVRHKGFIPWDDDIDVAMPRADYEKFLKEAPALLPPHLFLQCRDSDTHYNLLHSKLRDSYTTFFEQGWKKRKGNQGIFIDIFPWDYFPTKGLKAKLFRLKKKFYQNIISFGSDINYWKHTGIKNKTKAFLKPIINLFYPDKHKIAIALDQTLRKLPTADLIGNQESSASSAYKTILFENVKEVPFEDIMINVPQRFDEYLTACYGDYMQLPPKDEQQPRHFGGVIDTERSYKDYTEILLKCVDDKKRI